MTDPDVRKLEGVVQGLRKGLSDVKISVERVDSAVDEVSAATSALGENLAAVGGRVDRIQKSLDALGEQVNDFRQSFDEWTVRDEWAKQLAMISARILELRQEIERDFAAHDDVRRQAKGLMLTLRYGFDLDPANASSEQLLLQAPRYWLASAVFSVDSWIRGMQPRAERARQVALKRNPRRTALFFALVMWGQERYDTAGLWVDQYVGRLDPEKLTTEFNVVLDAVTNGVFGAELRNPVQDKLRLWYDELTTKPGRAEEQVERWRDHILSFGSRTIPADCADLELHADIVALEGVTALVAPYATFDQAFRQIVGEMAQLTDNLSDRADEVLDSLVDGHDDDERKLHDYEQYLQETKQELERRAFELGQRVPLDDRVDVTLKAFESADETVDFLSFLTSAAIEPQRMGVSPRTRLLALALAHLWVLEAVDQLSTLAKERIHDPIDILVDGWSGAVNVETTSASLVSGMNRYVEKETKDRLAEVRIPRLALAGMFLSGGVSVIAVLQIIGLLPIDTEPGILPVALVLAWFLVLPSTFYVWSLARPAPIREGERTISWPRERQVRRRRVLLIILWLITGRRFGDTPGRRRYLSFLGLVRVLNVLIRAAFLLAIVIMPLTVASAVASRVVPETTAAIAMASTSFLALCFSTFVTYRSLLPELRQGIEMKGAQRKLDLTPEVVRVHESVVRLRAHWMGQLGEAESLRASVLTFVSDQSGRGTALDADTLRGGADTLADEFPTQRVRGFIEGADASDDDGRSRSTDGPDLPSWSIQPRSLP